MRKTFIAATAAAAIGILAIPGHAGAAPGGSIHWGANSVTADLPSEGNWELYVNEPDNGNVVIGDVFGSSGSLTVQIPPFCGVVQADLLNGGKKDFGHRMTYNSCTTPTTTPTTVPVTTPTTVPVTTPPTTPPPTIPTGVTVPPVGTSVPPVTTGPPAAPSLAPSAAPVPVVTSPVPTATTAPVPAPNLPYTGVDTKLLGEIGLWAVVAGQLLVFKRRTV